MSLVQDLIQVSLPKIRVKLAKLIHVNYPCVSQGLNYLHSTRVKQHGNLKSTKCLLDGQMTLKISDYGHEQLSRRLNGSIRSSDVDKQNLPFYKPHCWMAPEVLRGEEASPQSDIYSFSIIVHQILLGCKVFGLDCPETEDMLMEEGKAAVLKFDR